MKMYFIVVRFVSALNLWDIRKVKGKVFFENMEEAIREAKNLPEARNHGVKIFELADGKEVEKLWTEIQIT